MGWGEWSMYGNGWEWDVWGQFQRITCCLNFYVTDIEPGKLSCLWESLFAQFATLLPIVV